MHSEWQRLANVYLSRVLTSKTFWSVCHGVKNPHQSSDDRKIQLCPSSPQINFNFLAANLGSCEPNRFGQVDSDKDSLVAQIEWGTFKMLLTGDNKSDEQLAMVDFYSGLGTGELNNVTVLKAASHGSDYGTQQQLGFVETD